MGEPGVGLVLGMERALPFYGFHKNFRSELTQVGTTGTMSLRERDATSWEGAQGEFRRATVTKVNG